jgi:hypothetical protein
MGMVGLTLPYNRAYREAGMPGIKDKNILAAQITKHP